MSKLYRTTHFSWKLERNVNHQKKVAKQHAIVGRKIPQILKKCGKMCLDHAIEVFKLDALEAIASPVKMFGVDILLL